MTGVGHHTITSSANDRKNLTSKGERDNENNMVLADNPLLLLRVNRQWTRNELYVDRKGSA